MADIYELAVQQVLFALGTSKEHKLDVSNFPGDADRLARMVAQRGFWATITRVNKIPYLVAGVYASNTDAENPYPGRIYPLGS